MKLTLRFIRNHGFISKAIQWECWGAGGSYSHVEFCLPNGYLGSQAPDGVRLRPLDYCNPSAELRVYVDVPDDVGAAVMAFAWSQLGKPYDYTSILGFMFKRDWNSVDKWFCSELVAAAFEHARFPLLRTTEVNRISPSTLSLSPYLVEVKNA